MLCSVYCTTQSLPFPISLTFTTLLIKFIIAWICRRIIYCFTHQQPLVIGWRTYAKRVMPPGTMTISMMYCYYIYPAFTSGLDIGLSNWSLLFITVSL